MKMPANTQSFTKREFMLFPLVGIGIITFALSLNATVAPIRKPAGTTFPKTTYALWKSRSISVCIEPVDQTLDVLNIQAPDARARFGAMIERGRQAVKAILENEYNARTIFKFRGFDYCSALSFTPERPTEVVRTDFEGLRIFISPKTGGGTRTMGRFTQGLWAGVLVGYGLENIDCNQSQEKLDGCLQGTTLHEIGHALGLGHELERMDNPVGVDDDQYVFYRTPKAVPIGNFDPNSVMNYRSLFQMKKGILPMKLSAGDIQSLQLLYAANGSFSDEKNEGQLNCLRDEGVWISRRDPEWVECCKPVKFDSRKDFIASPSTPMCPGLL